MIILAVWEALGVITVLFTLNMPGLIVFGTVIRGGMVVTVMLANTILSGTAAWLIFRRRLTGWNIAAGKALFWGVSMAVTLARGNITQLYLQVIPNARQVQILEWFPHFFQYTFMAGTIIFAVFVTILFSARKFFLSALPAPAAE